MQDGQSASDESFEFQDEACSARLDYEGPMEGNNQHSDEPNSDIAVNEVIKATIGLLFLWQATYHISDNALEKLLSLIHQFLLILNSVLGIDAFEAIISVFPSSLFRARQLCSINTESFDRYVSCPKCHSLYTYDEA